MGMIMELIFFATMLCFAMLHVVLAVNVIRIRRRQKIAIGDQGHHELARAMRVQANFLEQSLFAIVMLIFLFMQGGVLVANILSVLLLMGRVCHAYGMSQTSEDFRFRVAGMMISFGVTITTPIFLFLQLV